MIIGVYGIKDLLRWFHTEQPNFKFLILYVCKKKSDANLISGLLNEHLEIDLATKKDIIVFLFYDRQKNLANFQTGPHRQYLPASLPLEDTVCFQRDLSERDHRLFDWNFKLTRTLRIADIKVDKDVMDEINEASLSYSEKIANFFKIPTTKLPAVVCVEKGNNRPIVAQTYHNEDASPLINFLYELSDLIEAENMLIPLDLSSKKLRQEIENVREELLDKSILDNCKKKHLRYKKKLAEYLARILVDEEIIVHAINKLDITNITDENVEFVINELAKVDKYSESVKKLKEDVKFRSLLESIDKNRARYYYYSGKRFVNDKINKVESKVKHHINILDSEIKKIKYLNELLEKLQKKYYISSKFNYLKTCFNNFAYLLKKIRSMKDDAEAIVENFIKESKS